MCKSGTVGNMGNVDTKNFQKDEKKPGLKTGLFCMNSFKASAPQFIETRGIIIQQLKKLHQCLWRFGLSKLITRKGIGSSTEQFTSLPLIKAELFPHGQDKTRIEQFFIHLTAKCLSQPIKTFRFLIRLHALSTHRTKIRTSFEHDCLSLVREGEFLHAGHQFRTSAFWTLHITAP